MFAEFTQRGVEELRDLDLEKEGENTGPITFSVFNEANVSESFLAQLEISKCKQVHSESAIQGTLPLIVTFHSRSTEDLSKEVKEDMVDHALKCASRNAPSNMTLTRTPLEPVINKSKAGVEHVVPSPG